MDVCLTAQQLKRLADWVQSCTFGRSLLSDGKAEFPSALAQDSHLRIVFITLSDNQGQHCVSNALAVGIRAATEQALSKALAKASFKPLALKLDVVDKTRPISEETQRKNKKVIPDPSLFGIAFGQFSHAWLPEQNIRYRLVRKDRGIDYSVIKQQFKVASPSSICAFTTQAVFVTATRVCPLYRGHPLEIDLTPHVAKHRALAGADYLTRAVDPEGRFDYLYKSGLDISADDYNIVRHAGTIWAMLELLKEQSNADKRAISRASIDRAVQYLLACTRPVVVDKNGPNALVVVENDKAKLGGNGLAIVALVEYYKLAPDAGLLTVIRGLAQWLLDNQNENGEFYAHKVDVNSGQIMDFISGYYPGEAILGLMRLYSIDGDQKWQQAAVAATRWLINHRDAGKTIDDLDHDHWLMYAINEVYRAQPEPLLIEHMRKLVRAILSKQHVHDDQCKYPDWRGSWYKPPRTTPAACRVEGLMAAAAIMDEVGEPAETDELMSAAKAGLRFQLQNQLWDEKLIYLADPERARGGFHSNLTNWHIRIDYVQHTIVALIAWARRATLIIETTDKAARFTNSA